MWPRAVRVEVPAVELGIGDDRAPRDLVERDVLRRQVRRRGHRDAVAQPLRKAQRPAQRLHATEAAADRRGELLDAQCIHQPRLRIDPVFDGHDRKVGTVDAPGVGVHVHRPRRAETRAGVVDADDEEAVRVERLARADEVVPPALVLPRARAGHVVARVQRVAHQHRVALRGVQRAVGLVDERVVAQAGAAAQRQRLREHHGLRLHIAD
jgi:hypothetical protein